MLQHACLVAKYVRAALLKVVAGNSQPAPALHKRSYAASHVAALWRRGGRKVRLQALLCGGHVGQPFCLAAG
jgi:hypothetical protein